MLTICSKLPEAFAFSKSPNMLSKPKFLRFARSVSRSGLVFCRPCAWNTCCWRPDLESVESPQLLNNETVLAWFCWFNFSRVAIILAMTGSDGLAESAIFAGFMEISSCFCSPGSVLRSLVPGVFLIFKRPSVAVSSWSIRRKEVAWLSSLRKSSIPPTLGGSLFFNAKGSWPVCNWLRLSFEDIAFVNNILSP